MPRTTASTVPSSKRTTAAAGCALLSFFFGFCAILALVVAGADAFVDARHARWPVVFATVVTREVVNDHPYSKSRRPFYHLSTTVRFPLAGNVFVTSKTRTAGVSQAEGTEAMRNWIEAHAVGTQVLVRYDPSSPLTAELVDAAGLVFARHVREDLQLAAVALGLGIVTFVLARVLRARGLVKVER